MAVWRVFDLFTTWPLYLAPHFSHCSLTRQSGVLAGLTWWGGSSQLTTSCHKPACPQQQLAYCFNDSDPLHSGAKMQWMISVEILVFLISGRASCFVWHIVDSTSMIKTTVKLTCNIYLSHVNETDSILHLSTNRYSPRNIFLERVGFCLKKHINFWLSIGYH